MTEKRLINVRVSAEEDALLAAYAERTGRTRTDVLRELIRSLKRKLQAIERRAAAPGRGSAAKSTVRQGKAK
jgi:uncharacterized protein (DUF1778 family)